MRLDCIAAHKQLFKVRCQDSRAASFSTLFDHIRSLMCISEFTKLAVQFSSIFFFKEEFRNFLQNFIFKSDHHDLNYNMTSGFQQHCILKHLSTSNCEVGCSQHNGGTFSTESNRRVVLSSVKQVANSSKYNPTLSESHLPGWRSIGEWFDMWNKNGVSQHRLLTTEIAFRGAFAGSYEKVKIMPLQCRCSRLELSLVCHRSAAGISREEY